jgi:hypothetical protein
VAGQGNSFSALLFALSAARKERYQRHQRNRLKDLPNITFSLRSAFEAGITNEETLRALGAKASWLKMRKIKHSVLKCSLRWKGLSKGA